MELRKLLPLALVTVAAVFLVCWGPAEIQVPQEDPIRDAVREAPRGCGDDVTCDEASSKAWHATSEARSELMATHLVQQISQMYSMQHLQKQLSILDYGCSTGQTTFSIKKVFPNAAMTGFDVDPASVDKARLDAVARSLGSITFVTKLNDIKVDGLSCLNVFAASHSAQDVANKILGLLTHVKDAGFLWVVFKTSSDDTVLQQFLRKLPATDVNSVILNSALQAADQMKLDAKWKKRERPPVAPRHYFLLRNSPDARSALRQMVDDSKTSGVTPLFSADSNKMAIGMAQEFGDMLDSSYRLGSALVTQGSKALSSAGRQKFPTLTKEQEQAFHRKLDADWDDVMKLPICSRAGQVCTKRNILRLKFALLAEGKMYKDIFYMGGPKLASYVVLCFCIGILVTLLQRLRRVREEDETIASGESKQERQYQQLFSGFFWRLRQLHDLVWKPLDYCCSWWWIPPDFAHPLLSMKLFVTMLLFIELSVWMSPEQCVLATPELISLARKHPWKTSQEEDHNLVPPMAFWLMPGLNEATADSWVSYLQALRARMILSWCAFLMFPNRLARTRCGSGSSALVGYFGPDADVISQVGNGVLYGYGALVYAYLGTIGLMYNLAHSVQGGTLFVVAAIFAVPFLETNPRAGAWLRKFLIINVLVPVYLFAGLCKLRYLGLASNISGGWMVPVMQDTHRAIFPALNKWVTSAPPKLGFTTPWPCMVLSWGNLLVEFLLPLLCMMSTNRGFISCVIRLLFFFSCIGFHVGVFFTMGPNFMRQVVLIILACNPLYIFRGEAAQPVACASYGDRLRGVFGFLVVVGWYTTQLWSDMDHLLGNLPWVKHHNPYFPFPELSMFANGSAKSNYEMSCLTLIVLFLAFVGKMWGDVEMHRGEHGKKV